MKNHSSILLLSLFSLIFFSCSNSNSTSDSTDTTKMGIFKEDQADTSSTGMAAADISATKTDTAGSGRAEFRKRDDNSVELNLTLNFPKLAGQNVAVHLHEHGDCSGEGKGAHGHWNPTNEPHGKQGSASFHSGDIGNVKLNTDGTGTLTISSDRWSIGGDEKTNVLNKAVIVHSGIDDFQTQPTGNAGSRIGCGVIKMD